jgi:hypothetical protein
LIVAFAVAFVLGLAPSAQAANVVPNPGFEQGGCGDTPILCDWLGYPFMSQDTNAHSGNFAMLLHCGNTGCYADGFAPWVSLSAHVDPAACPAIGPGTHPASFWFSADAGSEGAGFGATFYSGPGCTGEQLGADSLGGSTAGGWQEVKGTLLAPSGTQSAYLYLGASLPCEDFCFFQASFDDLDVEDAVVSGAPTANAGPDQTVDEGTPVTLDGSGSSDPEGQALTYSWSQLSGPAVTLSDPSAVTPTFTAPDVAVSTPLTFQLEVCDPTPLCDTDTATVTVNAVFAPLTDATGIVILNGPVSSTKTIKAFVFKVTNVGMTPITLNLATDISSTVDVNGAPTGSVTMSPGTKTLSPGASERVKLSWSYPTGSLAPGDAVAFHACANAAGDIDATNNCDDATRTAG